MATEVTPQRRTVAYIRVSTEDGAKEGYSLDDQKRQTRAYALARDWPEVSEVYEDAGISGATRERPALKKLLADAKAGTIDKVICTKLDRMSRRAVDLLNIERELDECGVTRTYIKDSIDTSTPVGRLLRTVLAAVAELERDMILERTKAGYLEKARKGEVWRSKCPYGYRYLKGDKKTGTPSRLEVNPETAPVVQRIFERLAAGWSSLKVAQELTTEGVPTHKERGYWHDSTIRKIAQNPTYTGTAYWGKYRNVRTENGKARLVKNEDMDTVFALEVPAIVSPKLAETVRHQFVVNQKRARRNAKRNYLLGGGLVKCGVVLESGELCGHTMHGVSDPRSPGHYAYRCVCYNSDGKRIQHYLNGSDLDAAVWEKLRAILKNPDEILAEAEALSDATSQQAQAAETQILRLERQITSIARQQDELLNMRLANELDSAMFASKNTQLVEKKTALSEQVAAMTARRDAARSRLLPIDDVRAACAQMAQGVDAMTFDQQQNIVQTLCTRIVANKKDAHVEGAFPALSTSVSLSGQEIVTTLMG